MSGLMQSLWPSGRGILVCCIMSWYFVVLGSKRELCFKSLFGTVSMEMTILYLFFCTSEEQQGPGTQC